MAKTHYRFNPDTLNYEKVKTSSWVIGLKIFGFFSAAALFSLAIISASFSFLDSPNEKQLRKEISAYQRHIKNLENKVEQLDVVMGDLEQRDEEIYREIFEAPLPKSIRAAGVGGTERYSDLKEFSYGKELSRLHKKLDELNRKSKIQERSYDELIAKAKRKSEMLTAIPAIQPISNKNLTRMASGFGYRIDPIYKTRKMHAGMDFTSPTGTQVYVTGDGVIEKVLVKSWGYGKHIIVNHGYGYKTIYAHLSAFKVRPGQKVNRGEVIGLVGSTGKSTAPHLHYEVVKNGQKVNPANYYYNDLTPEEYEKMLKLASHPNQAFD
jgi:murein DD-endopeptidase MepM/ murein hydrolase activator NlpD